MDLDKHDCESRERLLGKPEDPCCPGECQKSINLDICRERRTRLICYGLSIAFSLIVTIAAFAIVLQNRTICSAIPDIGSANALDHASLPQIAQCGSNHAEAAEKGCIFDPMAAAYLPPSCYDHELFLEAQHESTSNYLSWERKDPFTSRPAPETFEWYNDQNLTVPIAQDEIPTTALFQAFTWEAYHVAHCEYVATQLLKASRRIQQGEKNVYVNSGALNEAHRKHCRYVLGEQVRRVGDVALVVFGYGNCTKLT